MAKHTLQKTKDNTYFLLKKLVKINHLVKKLLISSTKIIKCLLITLAADLTH